MNDPLWDDAMETLRRERTLPEYLQRCRWFGGKAQALRDVRILDAVPLGEAAGRLAFIEVNYADAAPEIYQMPLQLAAAGAGSEAIVDALEDGSFRSELFEIILGEKRLPAAEGEIVGICGAALRAEAGAIALPVASRALKAEQSNSAIIYDDRFFLKLYRKLEAGENPDAELLRFLSERRKFAHVPAFCGAIKHRVAGAEPRVLALLVANVPNEGDAWTFTLAALERFFERPDDADTYPARARQLGERTAQMHLALAADLDDPAFAPEPFTEADQRALHESMRAGTQRMLELLDRKLAALPEKHRAEAAALLRRGEEITARQAALLEHGFGVTRIRHHGDYHLGQVLNTGNDFIIIDFEGEPARSLAERRAKRSPLRDVAGMLRSFHYAAHTALGRRQDSDAEARAGEWVGRISGDFLEAYLATARGASFIPADPEALATLLEVHLLEKAAYEVCYELNNRPDWIHIPVRGILGILDKGRR